MSMLSDCGCCLAMSLAAALQEMSVPKGNAVNSVKKILNEMEKMRAAALLFMKQK